jgi:hypothetical protein
MPNGECDEHEREIEFIRGLAERIRTELSVLQAISLRLEESLFGKDGENGIIGNLKRRVDGHDRIIYIGMGIIVAMQFLSGNGIISLKGLLGK